MIWYLSLTWGCMVFGFCVLLYRFHRLDRQCTGVWQYLMQRAEVVALEDGWVTYHPKEIQKVPEPGIGFVPPAAPAAEVKPGE